MSVLLHMRIEDNELWDFNFIVNSLLECCVSWAKYWQLAWVDYHKLIAWIAGRLGIGHMNCKVANDIHGHGLAMNWHTQNYNSNFRIFK